MMTQEIPVNKISAQKYNAYYMFKPCDPILFRNWDYEIWKGGFFKEFNGKEFVVLKATKRQAPITENYLQAIPFNKYTEKFLNRDTLLDPTKKPKFHYSLFKKQLIYVIEKLSQIKLDPNKEYGGLYPKFEQLLEEFISKNRSLLHKDYDIILNVSNNFTFHNYADYSDQYYINYNPACYYINESLSLTKVASCSGNCPMSIYFTNTCKIYKNIIKKYDDLISDTFNENKKITINDFHISINNIINQLLKLKMATIKKEGIEDD